MNMPSGRPLLLTLSQSLLLLLTTAAALVSANVEKAIFLGPEPINVPLAKASLPALNLHTLTPDKPSVRTNLSRIFPTTVEPAGESAWLLLDNLTQRQRYELRVCWAAIEPTSFTLDVYELNTVWETPELVQSLATYAYSHMSDSSTHQKGTTSQALSEEGDASVLLLRIQAAADYFAHDASLMHSPPPVLVDLILDPFILNVVPRSLLPTAGYLVFVAVVTWFTAKWIAHLLQTVGGTTHQLAEEKKTR